MRPQAEASSQAAFPQRLQALETQISEADPIIVPLHPRGESTREKRAQNHSGAFSRGDSEADAMRVVARPLVKTPYHAAVA